MPTTVMADTAGRSRQQRHTCVAKVPERNMEPNRKTRSESGDLNGAVPKYHKKMYPNSAMVFGICF